MKLLYNKCLYHNKWFEGLNQLENRYPSIKKSGFYDTSSSAGDWNGYILQKAGYTYYAIPVSQENRYPKDGLFTKTGDYYTYVFYTRYVNIELSEIWDILLGCDSLQFPIQTLRRMWELLGDVSINDKEEIDYNFLLWNAGTERSEIWHWFDEKCPNGLVEDIITCKIQ